MAIALNEVRSLFCEALECVSEPDRRAYLDEACGVETPLRERVEALLAAHARAGQFLEQPGLGVTLPWLPSDDVDVAGVMIGPYRLVDLLGTGGMGVVYRAEQTEPIRREVALKVIRPGQSCDQVAGRFEVERQALALMDHPHIARVYDAGTTDVGQPYFVMELAAGEPITAFCNRQRLTLLERIKLFVLVCRAVQHAHQKGVIHRDLKPSNILVIEQDGMPAPKIIDFGVAHAAAGFPGYAEDEAGRAQIVGTPRYMSPEQADPSNLDIDTRSDVYSLGTLLCELLAGVAPLDGVAVEGTPLAEICRMVREHVPVRPSACLASLSETDRATIARDRRTDPRALARALAGDLDAIVLKCLEKDRTRRYQSAAALGDDLQRYLADRPVEAGPPSRRYRLAKFARRHRVALLTGGLVALSLLVGTAASLWQAVRATAAEGRAALALRHSEEQRALARRALDALFDEAYDRWCTPHTMRFAPLPQPFLERALPFYEGFADPKEINPEVGHAHRRVAEIRFQLWEAGSLESLKRASAIFEALLATDPDNRDYLDGLADCYADLANHGEMGHRHEEIAAWQTELTRRFPGEPRYRVQLATTRLSQGIGAWALELLPLADQRLTEACRVLEPMVRDDASDRDARNVMGHALRDLANAHRDMGGGLNVEATYRRAHALHETLVTQFPTRPHFRLNLAWDCWELGRYHLRERNFEQAERYAEQAADLFEGLYNDDPRVGGYSEYLSRCQAERAAVRLLTGRSAEAEPILRRIEATPESWLAAECLAQVAWYLVQDDRHRPEDAARAVDLARTALRRKSALIDAQYALGLAFYRTGRFDSALAILECLPDADTIRGSVYRLARGLPYVGFVRAMAHARRGERDKALAMYDRCVDWMNEKHREDPVLLRYRDEAAAVLGLKPDPMPNGSAAFVR